MRRFLRLAAIVGTLPNTIANGQTADATPLFADLNFIVTQVNANAAPLANTALLNATNSFTQPQGGVSAQATSQFVIAGDIITGDYQTLTSTLGTNALTARSTQIIPSSAQAGQAVFLIPSQTNTGAVSINRDSLGSFAVLQMGSGLSGGEFRGGVPVRLFLDGSNYHLIGPLSAGRIPGPLTVTGNITSGNQIRSTTQIFAGTDIVVNNVADLSAASAGQIKFPASQNPSANANILDDYSEGTWVPSVGGSATYTTQTGNFTKIGRVVSINCVLVINAIGSGSTTIISGLPFTPLANNSYTFAVANSANLATAVVSIVGRCTGAGATVTFFSRTAASTGDAINAVFANAAQVEFSGIYMTT